MNNTDNHHRPGNLLLDRYFPDADDETRERARAAFREWAVILEQLGAKISDRRKAIGSIPIRSSDNSAA